MTSQPGPKLDHYCIKADRIDSIATNVSEMRGELKVALDWQKSIDSKVDRRTLGGILMGLGVAIKMFFWPADT